MNVVANGELRERVWGGVGVGGSDVNTVEFIVVSIGRYCLVRLEHVSYYLVYIRVARWPAYGVGELYRRRFFVVPYGEHLGMLTLACETTSAHARCAGSGRTRA